MAKVIVYESATGKVVGIREITNAWKIAKFSKPNVDGKEFHTLVDPVIPADVPAEHLKIVNETVTEISEAEKDTVDDASPLDKLTIQEAITALILEAKANSGVENVTRRGLIRRIRAMRT